MGGEDFKTYSFLVVTILLYCLRICFVSGGAGPAAEGDVLYLVKLILQLENLFYISIWLILGLE